MLFQARLVWGKAKLVAFAGLWDSSDSFYIIHLFLGSVANSILFTFPNSSYPLNLDNDQLLHKISCLN